MANDWDLTGAVVDAGSQVTGAFDGSARREAEASAALAQTSAEASLAKTAAKTAPRDALTLIQLGTSFLGTGATLYFQLAPGYKWRRLSTVLAAFITLAILIAIEKQRKLPKAVVKRADFIPPTTNTDPSGKYSGPIADVAREVEEYEQWFNNAPW